MKKKEKNSFSRQVALIRLDCGMTQPELAQLMGVSVRTVSGWETGDRPPRHADRLLEEIQRATNCIKEDSSTSKPIINLEKKQEDIVLQKDLIVALQKIVERDELIFQKDERILELETLLKKASLSSQNKKA